uniref:Parcxpwnx04 n=1 Tax=Periplaneta americana TaxID=6978 RepID=Q5G5C1_PERAM|nr:Parcxpwnx04 [Periplaneta americana]
MTTAPCQNVSNPTQPCCRIPYRLPCYTNVQVPYQQCPIRYQQACGPQCINRPISQVVQPPVILPQPTCQPPYCPQPPPVYQPPIYQPPVYQPPVYLPQPICQQPYCPQPPPVYQPPVYQPPVYQPPVYQPPVYQPPVYQPPVSGCYINYPSPCPPQCLGACTYVPLQTGCAPLNQWPFLRCAPGNSYSYLGGYGGIGGYGTPGAGGYGAPGIGSYGTPGITPGIGGIGGVQPGQPFVG